MSMWSIDAGEDAVWRELVYADQPHWLTVRLRLAPTVDGVAVAGLQVDRNDGHALTARDLRLVKLPPNWLLFGEAAKRWYPAPASERPVQATRKGARGHDDQHWRMVWDAWRQAAMAAPRSPVKFLLRSGRWPVTDATMRRWIARARARAAELGWDTEPQTVPHFPRYDDQPPAQTTTDEHPDS